MKIKLILAALVALVIIAFGNVAPASALTYGWSEQVARLNAIDVVDDTYHDGAADLVRLDENHIETYCGYFVPCVWEFKYTVRTAHYVNAVQIYVNGCPPYYNDGCASVTRAIYYHANR